MKVSKLFFVFFIIFLQHKALAEDVAALFQKKKVVPDIIETAPPKFLKVAFDTADRIPTNGQTINEENSEYIHSLICPDNPCPKNNQYFLIVLAPDLPDPQNSKRKDEYPLIICPNMPGGPRLFLEDCQPDYIYPAIARTGLHRWIFLLYRQKHNNMDMKFMFDRTYRIKKFNMYIFDNTYRIPLIAGNIFIFNQEAQKKLKEKELKEKELKEKKPTKKTYVDKTSDFITGVVQNFTQKVIDKLIDEIQSKIEDEFEEWVKKKVEKLGKKAYKKYAPGTIKTVKNFYNGCKRISKSRSLGSILINSCALIGSSLI